MGSLQRLKFASGHLLSDKMLSVAMADAVEPLRRLLWSEGVGSLTRRQRFHLAMQIPPQLQAWRAEGGNVGRATYTSAIRAAALFGDARTSEQLYRSMVREGFTPVATIYEPLARAHALNGDVSAVFDVLARMRRQGVRPTTAIYQGAIVALGQQGEETTALKCFDAVLKEGLEVTPRLVSDTIAACTHPASAEKLLARAVAYGVAADIRMYNSVLQVYLKGVAKDTKRGITGEIRKLVAAGTAFARAIPLAKNSVTHNLLMKMHSAVGDLPAVLRQYKQMADTDEPAAKPTLQTYGAVIRAVAVKVQASQSPPLDAEVRVAEAAHRQATLQYGSGHVNLDLKLAEVYSAGARTDALNALMKRRERESGKSRKQQHPMFVEYLKQGHANKKRFAALAEARSPNEPRGG